MSRIKEMLQESFSRWSDHEAFRLGAALTFYTILSLSPLLVLMVGVAALVFGADAARQAIMEQAQAVIGAEGAQTIATAMDEARQPGAAGIAGLLSLGVLLFSASGVFMELRSALNKVWDVAEEKTTGAKAWIKDRLFSVGMALALGFLLLVFLVVSTVLSVLTGVLEQWLPLPGPAMYAIGVAIALTGVALVFALIFKYVPKIDIGFRQVLPGAFFTAVLFEIGRLGLSYYLGSAAVGSAYGAAGSLVVVLVWLFYASLIFYFGAEFTRVWAERHGWRRQRAEAPARAEEPERERSPGARDSEAQPQLRPAPAAGRRGLALTAGALAAMAMMAFRRRG
jgi:membrane protein